MSRFTGCRSGTALSRASPHRPEEPSLSRPGRLRPTGAVPPPFVACEVSRGQVGHRAWLNKAQPAFGLRDDTRRGLQLGHLQAKFLVARLLGRRGLREPVEGELVLGDQNVEASRDQGKRRQGGRCRLTPANASHSLAVSPARARGGGGVDVRQSFRQQGSAS